MADEKRCIFTSGTSKTASSSSVDWSGFYKKSVAERQKILAEASNLDSSDLAILNKDGPLPLASADQMSENVVGTFGLPLSVALNFVINGKEYVVPMAIEEPSVVAAASNAAKMARATGGFRTTYTGSIMIGQIQLVQVRDMEAAKKKLEQNKAKLIEQANSDAKYLTAYGGGVTGLQWRTILTDRGQMLIVEFLVNVVDAMGANMVNTTLERMAPTLEELCEAKSRLKILSNLATHRMASATAVWKAEDIGGKEVAEGILDAWTMAMADPYRRATHNKGVMNGIDAVAVALGNDWRAVEAGAHSYAAMKNAALTSYRLDADGNVEGKIVLPLAVGTVGGSMKANPTAALCHKILGAKTSGELAQVMAAVGLAQNFAALRAMASEGIQKGHMRLHARHIAMTAGAKESEVDEVVKRMTAANSVNEAAAAAALKEMRGKK